MDRFDSQLGLHIRQSFSEFGFTQFPLPQSNAVYELQKILLEKLRKRFGNVSSLEDYHLHVSSDEEHHSFQYELYSFLKDNLLHEQIINENLDTFSLLVGYDIDLQVNPYIRIARPNCPQDNVGYHRDTLYGNSAYEISCVFPLSNVDEVGALKVAPSSHLLGKIETIDIPSEHVVKGSNQHEMGFVYQSRNIDQKLKSLLVSQPISVGEVLAFSVGLLHGQEVNLSNQTRWSIDCRIRNAFFPVSKSLKRGYYKPLCRSPLSIVAENYYKKSNDERGLLIRKEDIYDI